MVVYDLMVIDGGDKWLDWILISWNHQLSEILGRFVNRF